MPDVVRVPRSPKSLAGLAALPRFKSDPELAAATTHYAEFTKIKTQILALSRENTNVRSLSISLNQMRKETIVCQEALAALRDAILAESIPGVDYGQPSSPR